MAESIVAEYRVVGGNVVKVLRSEAGLATREAEDAESGDRRARWSLRFSDPAQEVAYRQESFSGLRPRLPFIVGIVAAAWLVAVPADVVMVKGALGPIEAVRGVTVLVLLAVLGAIQWAGFARRYQMIAAGLCLVTTVAVITINVMPGVPHAWPFGAALTEILFTLLILRLLLVYCVPVGLTVVALYLGSEAIRGASLADWILDVFYLSFFLSVGLSTAYTLERLSREAFVRERVLAEERALSDRLLHSILPVPVAARLRQGEKVIAESLTEVTALFADIVGFTPLSETLDPHVVVDLLDRLFSRIDARCEVHGIEKIKIVGDAYMAVSGAPVRRSDHAFAAAELALDVQAIAREMSSEWPDGLRMRIGLNSGPVVAGVIGRHKPAYDMWGDTVNTAARMESQGLPGQIQVSAFTRAILGERYRFSEPTETAIKGKGVMTTYFLLGRSSSHERELDKSPLGRIADLERD